MLNFVNRLLVSILLLLLIVLLVAVAVTPQGVAGFLASQLSQVRVDALSVDHLIIAVISAILVVGFVGLLGLEWRRPRPQAIPLTGSGTGKTSLAAESVIERLRQDVQQMPQVRQATPILEVRRNAVDVLLEVRTDPDVDVPTKASEIDQVARDSVARLGLKLNRLQVKIHVARGAASQMSAGPP
jgi:hypothetical protein